MITMRKSKFNFLLNEVKTLLSNPYFKVYKEHSFSVFLLEHACPFAPWTMSIVRAHYSWR